VGRVANYWPQSSKRKDLAAMKFYAPPVSRDDVAKAQDFDKRIEKIIKKGRQSKKVK